MHKILNEVHKDSELSERSAQNSALSEHTELHSRDVVFLLFTLQNP